MNDKRDMSQEQLFFWARELNYEDLRRYVLSDQVNLVDDLNQSLVGCFMTSYYESIDEGERDQAIECRQYHLKEFLDWFVAIGGDLSLGDDLLPNCPFLIAVSHADLPVVAYLVEVLHINLRKRIHNHPHHLLNPLATLRSLIEQGTRVQQAQLLIDFLVASGVQPASDFSPFLK